MCVILPPYPVFVVLGGCSQHLMHNKHAFQLLVYHEYFLFFNFIIFSIFLRENYNFYKDPRKCNGHENHKMCFLAGPADRRGPFRKVEGGGSDVQGQVQFSSVFRAAWVTSDPASKRPM